MEVKMSVKTTYLCTGCRKDVGMKFEEGYKPHLQITRDCPHCRKRRPMKLVRIKGLRLLDWVGHVR